jgi:hypothetical protein
MDPSSDEESYYETQVEPASLAPTGESATWAAEGNPFGDSVAQFVPMFEELDVEGLIREPGFELEDNDLVHFPTADKEMTSLWVLEPHPPLKECGCQWCESYRVGGNWEPYDLNK